MTEPIVHVNDFIQWKADAVTKYVDHLIRFRINVCLDYLSTSAGLDSLQDRFVAGMIHAFNEVLNISYEEPLEAPTPRTEGDEYS